MSGRSELRLSEHCEANRDLPGSLDHGQDVCGAQALRREAGSGDFPVSRRPTEGTTAKASVMGARAKGSHLSMISSYSLTIALSRRRIETKHRR